MKLRVATVLATATLTIVGSAQASTPRWAGLTRSQAINQAAHGAAQFILANRDLNHEARSAAALTSMFLHHLIVAKHETCLGGHKAWLVSFLGDRQWKTAIGPTGNLVATDVSSGITNVNSNTTPGCSG